jgi:hypothetical protein
LINGKARATGLFRFNHRAPLVPLGISLGIKAAQARKRVLFFTAEQLTAQLAAAILDRLLHHSYPFLINGKSFRM